MIITLVPVAQLPDTSPDVLPTVSGNVILYRGEVYDFTPLLPGYEIEPGLPFDGVVKNVDGVIHATLIYQFDTANALPIQSVNPSDYVFDVVDGMVPDPIKYYDLVSPEVSHVD